MPPRLRAGPIAHDVVLRPGVWVPVELLKLERLVVGGLLRGAERERTHVGDDHWIGHLASIPERARQIDRRDTSPLLATSGHVRPTPENAELVAFWILEDDPWLLALSHVSARGAERLDSRATSSSRSHPTGLTSIWIRFFTVFFSGTGTKTRHRSGNGAPDSDIQNAWSCW